MFIFFLLTRCTSHAPTFPSTYHQPFLPPTHFPLHYPPFFSDPSLTLPSQHFPYFFPLSLSLTRPYPLFPIALLVPSTPSLPATQIPSLPFVPHSIGSQANGQAGLVRWAEELTVHMEARRAEAGLNSIVQSLVRGRFWLVGDCGY